MKLSLIYGGLFAAWLALTTGAFAQIEVVSSDTTPAVFGGGAREVIFFLRNNSERTITMNLKTRLYQISSATEMPVGRAEPWKSVTVLGGQTVLEPVALKFPDVRAATKFEVRWLDDAERTAGRVLVTVFPTNLLKQIADLAGDKPPGVYDPHERLTPLLRNLAVEFDDLHQSERLRTWNGRLAILGPFDTRLEAITKRAQELARRGANVLLLLADEDRADSAVRVPGAWRGVVFVCSMGGRRIVSAPAEMIAGLAADPRAQGKLLELARLAVAADLPQTETEP